MCRSQAPTLLAPFAQLKDPRIDRTKVYGLLDLIFIALCAVVSGANDCVGIAKFANTKRVWLEKYLDLPEGETPSHDTFTRVFAALDGRAFVDCFLQWVAALEESTAGKVVAIDGKTARATLDRRKQKNPLHVVSAWVTENQLFLGQEVVDDKSNEITAIPKLLAVLELKGALVTIDALGCQKEIADTIREQGADYVLAVKGNQEHLEDDVVAAFAAVDEDGSTAQVDTHKVDTYTEDNKGHGREESRRTQTLPVPDSLRNQAAWRDLWSIARCTRTYTERGVEKSEVRYFISSLKPDAQRIARAIRGHWGIENGLHWVLDLYFAEDRNRARTGNAAANLALLRRWVISLLRRDTSIQGGIEKKRLQAAWNDQAREAILGLFVEK
jgi:predicted transposase YbfD/YdcC